MTPINSLPFTGRVEVDNNYQPGNQVRLLIQLDQKHDHPLPDKGNAMVDDNLYRLILIDLKTGEVIENHTGSYYSL